MNLGVKLVVVLALVLSCQGRPKKYAGTRPKHNKTPMYKVDRLDGSVTPTSYKLDLKVDEEGLTGADGTFIGIATIRVTINKAVKSVKFHAKDLSFAKEQVTVQKIKDDDTADVALEDVTEVVNKDDDDFVIITRSEDFEEGAKYDLTITYTGKLSDTDMEGFYRSYYMDGETKKYLATTQFEQMGARRAFPCFDEPNLKATFDISITVPKGYNAISNKEGKSDDNAETPKYTFPTTPIMSTYLVAFIVSDFTPSDDIPTEDDIPTRVYSRIGTEDERKLAADTAPEALKAMEGFTGVKYKEMDIKKLAQAAIPDFAAGAMENWGMLTYREADLLWDEAQSSDYYKQVVVTVTTHEIAHQWFGDYVTLDWWSNTFLNEGFATFFEYFGAHQIQTKWELDKQFVVDQLQTVLLSDSASDSQPLSIDAGTIDTDVIENRFNDISYNKGGSILRMVQSFIGEEGFKNGLNKYLTSKAGGNGDVKTLWSSFDDEAKKLEGDQKLPAETVEKVMDEWTNQPGYPLLEVTLEGDIVTITQKNRFLGAKNETTVWKVPVTYATSKEQKFNDTTTKFWISDTAVPVNLSETESDWIILNNQQVGYYRVNYDNTLLERIKAELNDTDSVAKFDQIARSALIDDQLNLARANLKDYGEVLGFLDFLQYDSSYYSWNSAFNGFSYLLKRTQDAKVQEALKGYILENMKELLNSISSNTDDQISILTRVLAFTWACKLENDTCLKFAKESFDKFQADTTAVVDRNLKSIVYCYGLQQSENASNSFDFLYGQYKSNDLSTEQVTILKALGCVDSSELRIAYLEKVFNDEIRIQDVRYVFSSVLSSGPGAIDDVITFVKNNWSKFPEYARFGDYTWVTYLISNVADLMTTDTQLSKLDEISGIEGIDQSIIDSCTKAKDAASANIKIREGLDEQLRKHFDLDNGGNAGAITSLHFVNLALVFVVYLLFNYN